MGDEAALRDIGPKDVDSAGDMVSRVGVHNQAKRLIKSVRESYPREMVAAFSRPVDQGRTKFIDLEEAERLVEDSEWDDVVAVEGARVHGKGKRAVVNVLIRLESGRSARGLIPYEDFEDSIAAYDRAVAEGGVVVTDEDDPRQLRRALEAAQKQIAEQGSGPAEEEIEKLVEQRANERAQEAAKEALREAGIIDEDGNPIESPPPEPYEGYSEDNVEEVVKKLDDLSLPELVALKEAEEAGDERKGVLEPLDEKLQAAEAGLRGESQGASSND